MVLDVSLTQLQSPSLSFLSYVTMCMLFKHCGPQLSSMPFHTQQMQCFMEMRYNIKYGRSQTQYLAVEIAQ